MEDSPLIIFTSKKNAPNINQQFKCLRPLLNHYIPTLSSCEFNQLFLLILLTYYLPLKNQLPINILTVSDLCLDIVLRLNLSNRRCGPLHNINLRRRFQQSPMTFLTNTRYREQEKQQNQ
ncbi:hypothetical protein KSS87_001842, partial [Heliosperma pusillum]